jgi:single-strand DNA-binding protein
MSFFVLVCGVLASDPAQRTGTSGKPFTTASIREDEVYASLIAFGELAEQLLGLAKGDALAVGGKAKLTQWAGKDGVERHGISITVSTIAAAKPVRHQRKPSTRSRAQRFLAPSGEIRDDGVSDLFQEAAT